MSLPEGIDIRCCDCLSPEGLPSIPDGSADLTVTSPPYDNLRQYGGYTFDFERTAQELWRVTKPGGVVVWVVADATVDGNETGASFRQALYFKRMGFNLQDTMVFHKSSVGACGSTRCYWQAFDFMFVLSKGTVAVFNPIEDVPNINAGKLLRGSRRAPAGQMKRYSGRFTKEFSKRDNVWTYHVAVSSSTDRIAYDHPAIFPEALARDHILSWSNPGDLVLDPMVGSGTTAKMAYAYGRRFIGFDCNPEYVEIAKRRLAQQRLVL